MDLTLLQTPLPNAAPPVAVPAWLAPAISLGALLLALWTLIRKEQREDGQTLSQRLKKLEGSNRDMETRMTGFQQQHERTAEKFTARCDDLQKMVDRVPGLSESIVRMETRLEENAKTVERMDKKMDKILDALTALNNH